MKEPWLVYSTFPNREEALSAARALVEQRLAACVHVHEAGMSVYRWQGGMQQEAEVAMIAKTRAEHVDAVIDAVKNLHSYQLPCIIAYPIAKGYTPFMQWITDETELPPS